MKKRKKIVLCQNCQKREATVNWVGEGGVLDYVHGMYKKWCEYCATKTSLEYAKRQARRIPTLEKKLARL